MQLSAAPLAVQPRISDVENRVPEVEEPVTAAACPPSVAALPPVMVPGTPAVPCACMLPPRHRISTLVKHKHVHHAQTGSLGPFSFDTVCQVLFLQGEDYYC